MILIIESQTNKSVNPPSIHCLSRAGTSKITTHPGQIIGAGESKLLITRVKPDVNIETTSKPWHPASEIPDFGDIMQSATIYD